MLKSQRFNPIAVAAGLLIVVLCLTYAECGTILRRSRSPSETNRAVELCPKSAPCGWYIYVPFTRIEKLWMPNTCVCPAESACVRTEDDLSISAYVHRCREKSTPQSPNENENNLPNGS